MLNYRAHVFSRYLRAMNSALAMRRGFLDWLAASEPKDAFIASLKEQYPDVVARIDDLFNALPDEVLDATKGSGLRRHLAWMDRRLTERKPLDCYSDIVDITERDLPSVLTAFDSWFSTHSSVDEGFVRKVERLVNIGQGDSAIRKAWAIFKSRLTNKYGLSPTLDGVVLANAVFGPSGAVRGQIPDAQCEGYLNLTKGLYALNRNEVTHNDVTADPQETEAVLMLLNSILARLDEAPGDPLPF